MINDLWYFALKEMLANHFFPQKITSETCIIALVMTQ